MTAVRARESHARGGATIGEVLTQLRPEFTDITISKIRFLESEGLVTPERTPSGYRKFTAEDIARLRYVLTQQRDNYLPLRVIKDQLDAIDRGLVPPGAGGVPRAPHLTMTETAPSAENFHPVAGDAAALARGTAQRHRPAAGAARRARAVRPDRGAHRRPLRRRRAGDRQGRGRDGAVRDRGSAPAGVPHGRRPRGRAVHPGRRADDASPRTRGEGARAGDGARAGLAVGAAALRRWSRSDCARSPARSVGRIDAVESAQLRRTAGDVIRVASDLGDSSNCLEVDRASVAGRRGAGRAAGQPPGAAAARRGRRAVPADLDRRGRGVGDRVPSAGRQDRPSADPRPACATWSRRSACGSRRCTSPRCAKRSSTPSCASPAGSASAPGRPTRSRSALRCDVAILGSDAVLDSAGIEIPDEQEDEVEKFREFLDNVSPEDFAPDS